MLTLWIQCSAVIMCDGVIKAPPQHVSFLLIRKMLIWKGYWSEIKIKKLVSNIIKSNKKPKAINIPPQSESIFLRLVKLASVGLKKARNNSFDSNQFSQKESSWMCSKFLGLTCVFKQVENTYFLKYKNMKIESTKAIQQLSKLI